MSFNLNTTTSLTRAPSGMNHSTSSSYPQHYESKYSKPTPYQLAMREAEAAAPSPTTTVKWNPFSPRAAASPVGSPIGSPSPGPGNEFRFPSTSPSASPNPSASPSAFNFRSATPASAASSTSSSTSSTSHHRINSGQSNGVPSSKPTPFGLGSSQSSGIFSTAGFNHSNIDEIAAQLHAVQIYKTPQQLILACCTLMIGASLLLYVLLAPMLSRVSIFGYFHVARELIQVLGIISGGYLTWTGVSGLHRYLSLQVPIRALEGLSERQKQLMGWSSASTSSASVQSAIRADEQATVERNQLRRRRALEGQASSSSSNTHPHASPSPPSTMTPTSGARASLGAIPTASLRFLDPQSSGGGYRSSFGGFSPTSLERSPYKTRGLDAHVHDEPSLLGFVADYSARRSDDSNLLTPPSNRYGSAVSPRNYNSTASFGTPPYATSLREAPAPAIVTPVVGSSAQPFILPGLRYTLDDPRADAELHDAFHLQLQTTLRKTTQELDGSVRRMRSWLVATILRPFLRALDNSTMMIQSLAQLILREPSVNQQFTPDELTLLKEFCATHNPTLSQHMPPALTARTEDAIALIRARFPQRPEVAARNGVDTILNVVTHDPLNPTAPTNRQATTSVKAYVARRLLQLCAPGDDSLSKYSVQVGGGTGTNTNSANNNAWSLFGAAKPATSNLSSSAAAAAPVNPNSFPTDSQILLHAFCAHMETVLPGFTHQYVRDASNGSLAGGVASLPRPTDGSACIVQLRPNNPPYFIVARSPTTGSTMSSTSSTRSSSSTNNSVVKYVTEPGRPSLFQALVLWTLELPIGSRLRREFTSIMNDI